MSIAARTIIENCQEVLNDFVGDRYPASTLIRHLNKAQRWMQTVRPDVTATREVWSLAAGFLQSLPVNASTLIDIPGNATGKLSRITKVDLPLLDASAPNWRSQSPKTEVIHFVHDMRTPRQILVYPPVVAGAQVYLEHSAYPVDIPAPSGDGKNFATVTGDTSVEAKWQTALESLVLHFAYAKDLESPANAQLAGAHMQMASQMLGVELQSSANVAPKE
jgi:hypothetical protein